jgi:hypothetical protein
LGKGWRNSEVHWQDIELLFEDELNEDKAVVHFSNKAHEQFLALGGKKIMHIFDVNDDHATVKIIISG